MGISVNVYSGEALDRQLTSLGQQRQTGESDWDCRKRVFPAIFEHDRRWAFEVLVGKMWQDFEPFEEILFQDLSIGKNPTTVELEKFARGFAVDPASR